MGAHYFSKGLVCVEFVVYFALGQILGAVKTLAAFPAAVGSVG